MTSKGRKADVKLVEFNHLSPEQKWRYLQAYWSRAREFYDLKELIISDEEVYAQIKKFKAKPAPKIRRVMALKDWRWKFDPELKGIREGYFRHDHADESWERTISPHNMRYAPPDPVVFGTVDTAWYNFPSLDRPTTIYMGEYALWYRASIPLAKQELEGKRAFLRFESCSIKTTAWVDEWPVILEHYGVYPFEMEITEELSKSGTNKKQISLQVVGNPSNTPGIFYNCLEYAYAEKRGEKILESQNLNWSGINGAVELVLTSPTYIKDIFIFTREIGPNAATLHVRLEIENTTTDLFEGKVLLDINRWYPTEVSNEIRFTADVYAKPLSVTVVEQDIELSNPVLWESWNPNLYLVHATLIDDTGSCDDLYETFGVRTFTAKDGEFLLNGKPITLAATHDQGLYPDTSPTCPGDYWIVQDYLLHKSLGMVAARYPSDNRVHYRRIAEYADQMGLMLIWEGYCSMWSQPPDIEDLARRDVPKMIRDLRNHPSIVVWVLGDETFYYAPADSVYQNKRSHYVELVYELARQDDPSRLIVPVGHWVEDFVLMIEKHVAMGLSLEDARKKTLELLPVFMSPNVYWAIHSLPSFADTQPVFAALERYHRILCGVGKPVTFDEFGCEGMPDWELSKGEWWYKRWTINPMLPAGKKFLEPALIGRELSLDDWQVSQAYQASVNWRVLSYIRESGAFAGFSVCHLRDVLNYYAGLVDSRGRAKLAYFLFRNMLSQFFISAMHGNYLFRSEDQLSITVSNNGPALKGGKLKVKITNENSKIAEEKTIGELTLHPGLTHVLSYELKHLPGGLYSIEYYLYDENGDEAGRSLDMFFVE